MVVSFSEYPKKRLKGGYLDFSHLTELKNIYIIGIYLKKKKKRYLDFSHFTELKNIYITEIYLKPLPPQKKKKKL